MAKVRRGYKIIRNGKHVGNATFFGPTVKAAESEARKYAGKIGAKVRSAVSNRRKARKKK